MATLLVSYRMDSLHNFPNLSSASVPELFNAQLNNSSTRIMRRRPQQCSFVPKAMVKAGGCSTCKGKGALECKGCKGTGKNKKNGNIFERWKCYDCQGFGLVSCPGCGKGGLTPEQRGER